MALAPILLIIRMALEDQRSWILSSKSMVTSALETDSKLSGITCFIEITDGHVVFGLLRILLHCEIYGINQGPM